MVIERDGKRKWKILVPIIAACLIAGLVISYFAFWQNTGSTVPNSQDQDGTTPAEPKIDSDGDGFSDQFEEDIAGYALNVSNDRYFIYCEYLPETERENNIVFSLTWHLLVEGNGVPSQNIIRLAGENATRSNFQSAIEEIAAKADENDTAYISLLGHGGCDSIVCCCDGGLLYSRIDELLDEIQAKVVII